MRFAYVVGDPDAPSETFIRGELLAHVRAGHSVDLYPEFASGESPELVGPRIERLPAAWSGDRSFSARIAQSFKAVSPTSVVRDLNVRRYGRPAVALSLSGRRAALKRAGLPRSYAGIHAHFIWNGVAACWLREQGLLDGPVGVAVHGADISSYLDRRGGQQALKYVLASADVLMPVSDFWADELVRLGAPKEKVFVQRMGVDVSALADERFPGRRRASNGMELVSVGRLVEKKGFAVGIQAVARLVTEAGIPVRYQIVGDGPDRAALLGLIEQLGMADVISLVGWQPPTETLRFIADADALLVPSVTAADGDREGVPMVVMEAMASGTLVVASRHSGIPELVEDRVTGLLTEEGDARDIAVRLEEALCNGQELQAMILAAKDLVLRRADVDKQAAALRERYIAVTR